MAFVLNGKTMLNITAATKPKPVFWDVPFYLILNTAVGGGCVLIYTSTIYIYKDPCFLFLE